MFYLWNVKLFQLSAFACVCRFRRSPFVLQLKYFRSSHNSNKMSLILPTGGPNIYLENSKLVISGQNNNDWCHVTTVKSMHVSAGIPPAVMKCLYRCSCTLTLRNQRHWWHHLLLYIDRLNATREGCMVDLALEWWLNRIHTKTIVITMAVTAVVPAAAPTLQRVHTNN